MKPYRFSLTFAILSTVACLLVLTWLLLSLISFTTAENDLIAQKNDEGKRLVGALAAVLPDPVTRVRTDPVLQRMINRLASEQSIIGLLVVDGSGTPVFSLAAGDGTDRKVVETAHSGRDSSSFSPDGKTLYRYAPVSTEQGVAGAVRIALSLSGEQARLKKSRNLFLTYFALDFLLLLGLGYFLLNRIIVVPIRRLLNATVRVAAGDYGSTVQAPGAREVAELAESFNAMVSALRAKRQEVDRHVESLEQANRELRVAREETIRSEKMASVGLLAAGMAHEVGSPLSAIIGFVGILREELRDDHEKADYLRRIGNEACRIDRIVRGLLDYARPSPSEREPVVLTEVIAATLELLEAQGALKGIRLDNLLPSVLPPVVIDRHEFQQVLINLLLNARDAMPNGGAISVSGAVESRPAALLGPPGGGAGPVMGRRRDDFNGAFRASFDHRAQSAVQIAIVDTGTGIAPDILGRIFDPFFTTKEPGQGTGLGLAICARIIDSFGGRIIAQSEVGKGTAFTILLPVPEETNER